MVVVSIQKCPDYEEQNVSQAILSAMAQIGGMARVIRPGDKVLLKANLLAPADPDAAVTTHPGVVKAVAGQVLAAGGIPIVADSPGYFYAGGKCRAIKACGMRDVGDDLNITTTQFESVENPFVEVQVPGGQMLDHVYAARLALEADVIITLPKLKTHASTWYTGAIKNMFGAVATRTRKQAHRLATHEHFSAALVDVYAVFRPQVRLAIMDGVTGMEGEGPRHGSPRQAGLILASFDAVALDTVATAVMGFEPTRILTTRYAAERGFGVGELAGIDILGEPLDDVVVDFSKPTGRRLNVPPLLMKAADRLLKVRPELNRDDCDKCGTCAKSCPVDAITMNSYPEIDRDLCIECFCCNEMCPTGAMAISKNWLARRVS